MQRFMTSSKPWVASSPYELMQDALVQQQYVEEYLQESPFPGTTSTVEEKVKWLKAIQAQYDKILEEDFYMTNAPESNDVVKKILLEHAPDEIRVDVVLKVKELEDVAAAMKEDEKVEFVNNFPKLKYNSGKEDDGSSSALDTFDACIDWIKENAVAGPASVYSGHVVVASFMSTKDSDLSDKVLEAMESIGIKKHYLISFCCGPLEHGLYFWNFNDKVGENMYTTVSSDDTSNFKYSVTITTRIPKDSPLVSQVKAFKEKLDEMKKSSKDRGNPKTPVLVEKEGAPEPDSEDEEENPQTDQFYEPLWVPECYKTFHTQIYDHFMDGEGETSDIKNRLQKGNTDTGNLREWLFRNQLAYVKKIKSSQERFAAALALTMVITYDPYWMVDNEGPDEVKKAIRGLATLWRNNLLTLDDSSLGIGIEDGTEEPLDDNGVSHSRSLLYKFMTTLAQNIQSVGVISKFNWKPAASRKRKST